MHECLNYIDSFLIREGYDLVTLLFQRNNQSTYQYSYEQVAQEILSLYLMVE